MKKFTILLVALTFAFVTETKAQFDLGMLDNALSLVQSGKQKESSKILGSAVSLLTNQVQGSNGDFATKIMGQLGGLSAVLPALEKGTANMGAVSKIISTIKMLVGAMNLNNLIKGDSLLGKTTALVSNVNALKSGLSVLDGVAGVNKITKSLDKVLKKSTKLDKTGWAANMAQKAISKKLGSSLGLLSGLI